MSTDPHATPPLLPSLPPNRALEEHLRRSLAVLRDQSEDPRLRDRIDEVIRGRSSLRELAGDRAFGAMMEPLVTRGMQQLDALSPQERTAAEEGATAFARGETPAPSTGTGSGSGTDAPTGDRPDGPTAPGQRPGTPPEDNLGTW